MARKRTWQPGETPDEPEWEDFATGDFESGFDDEL